MKIFSDPLVSIATPVYNCGKYLAECIESLLSQTYKNWEYTIINNCSTDNTLSIAHSYAKLDNRINVITNKYFVEIMENHNIAFKSISPKSKYCKLLLADDWIFPDFLMEMVNLGEKYPNIGLICSYSLDGKNVIWDGLPYPSTFLKGNEICRLGLLENVYAFGNPTSQFYRSDIIRRYNNCYSDANIHADLEFCYEILQYSDFGFIHKILSFIRVREDSISFESKKLNSFELGKFIVICKYGPVFLSKEEYMLVYNRMLKNYYKLLAKDVLRIREKYFWDYQALMLNNINLSIDKKRLIMALFLEIVNRISHPIDSIDGIRKWWFKKL